MPTHRHPRYAAIAAVVALLAGYCVAPDAGIPVCGNRMVEAGETCDPPEPDNSAPDRCRSDCRFCGDGVVDFAFEACDDGNNASGDGCEADCHILTYVAVTGDDTTGDGSRLNPFRTIQRAFEQAGSFYTIMVGPGTYNECVKAGPPVAADRPVQIIAEAWQTASDNTATTVSGDGICDATQPLGNRAPVIQVASRASRVEGFTITRGGASGIIGAGGVVITNNVITDNRSSVGGGVYLNLTGTVSGDVLAEISGNAIIGNRAEFGPSPNGTVSDNSGDGGGIFVSALSGAGDVDVRIDGNRIEDNTINENSPLAEVNVFGGGLGVFTNSTAGSEVRVAVTNNLIADNRVEAGAQGYSGGAWVYTFGFGSETVDISGNTFQGNQSPLFGGGLSVWISTAGTRGDADPLNDSDIRHVVDVTDNVLFNNSSSNGGGLDLLLKAIDLRDDERAQINVAHNLMRGNDAFGGAAGYGGGGAGALVTLNSVSSATPETWVRLQDNTLQLNTAAISGGGVSVWIAAEADPTLATGRVDLVRNLITDNDASAELAGGGGVFAFLEAHGDATASLLVDRATIGGNTADFGAGGIHVESYTTVAGTPARGGQTELTLANSIVAANDVVGVGGPIPGVELGILAPDTTDNTGNIDVVVSYSDVFGHPNGNYDVWFPNPTGSSGNISADPEFEALWRVGPCSPTVDAADPGLDFSLEPMPNGGRANMGHTGGTTLATPGLADPSGDASVDGVDILKLSVAFGTSTGAPRYDPAADLNEDGVVDGADLALVAGDFGRSCSP